MKFTLSAFLAAVLLLSVVFPVTAADTAIGAAPRGDPTAVASKIIKYNFPECKHVSNAIRNPDGSIRAKCDRNDYLVFTIFNAKEGKAREVALNCTVAKNLLNISC